MVREISQARLELKFIDARLALRVLVLRQLLRKANFDPNQPRVPAGNSDGGRWADGNALGSLLEQLPRTPSSELAPSSGSYEIAESTTSVDYAARMLGIPRIKFGDMIHDMKHENRLKPNDNVTFHDNGDVYFRGKHIDNMFNYN